MHEKDRGNSEVDGDGQQKIERGPVVVDVDGSPQSVDARIGCGRPGQVLTDESAGADLGEK